MKKSHGQILFESLYPISKWEELDERGKLSYEKPAGILRRQILEELRVVAEDQDLVGSFHPILLNYELEKSK